MPQAITTSAYDFENLRNADCLYIDKTALLYELVKNPSDNAYFCARPRRFGKSLAVSTLKAIFEGKQTLFDGLAIADSDYDWQRYPVIHLDFGNCDTSNAKMTTLALEEMLFNCAKQYHIDLGEGSITILFSRLIKSLYDKTTQPVVILIDEYDKPLSDHIDDIDTLREMRTLMQGFYQILKGTNTYQRFLFMTGVTKYAKMSVFSGLNNLSDISMQPKYATLFGYTQAELEHYFSDYIADYLKNQSVPNYDNDCHDNAAFTKDTFLSTLKQWYNGYLFDHEAQSVYNPVSVGKFFAEGYRFKEFWIDTGTPSILINTIKRQMLDMLSLEGQSVRANDFSTFELERLAQNNLTPHELLVLFYQTGYVTIDQAIRKRNQAYYTLRYPNKEVKFAYVNRIVDYFVQGKSTPILDDIYDNMLSGDIAQAIENMKDYFTQFSYDIQVKQEKYYQSLFYALLYLVGLNIRTEQTTNIGRLDAIVETPQHLYIFELKYNQSAQAAIAQIKEKQYADKYIRQAKQQGKGIHLIGINFDGESRNIDEWCEEMLD